MGRGDGAVLEVLAPLAPLVAGGGTGSPDLPGHMGGGTGDTTEDQGGVASLSHAPCPFGILWEVRGSVPASSPLFWGQIGRVASSVGKPSRPLQGQQHQEAFGGTLGTPMPTGG